MSRRFAKHGLWLVLALATGLTFVGYFTPIRELVPDFFTGQVGGWALFWIGFFTFATYGNAGFMREQVCLYMCPYARFQSVMFDRDTLIVSYDRARASRAGAAPVSIARNRPGTAWTAACACRSAPPASISARVCSTSASPAPPASTPVTR